LDYVTHSSSPIVHAADDKSVMETLEALPYQVQSTRAFSEGKSYWVGPSAIGARDNPYGAESSANPDNNRVCLAQMDPRQRGLFGAAWNLGYVAAFARGGVDVVTLGATTGPLGIVYRKTGDRQPFFDGLEQAAVYPVYHVIADLAAAAGEDLVATTSSEPGKVEAFAAHGPEGTHVWVANLTDQKQMVTLSNMPAGPAKLRMLDEANFVEATTQPAWFAGSSQPLDMKAPLRLGPYAVARIDWSSR
jgi:hypothetical protein